MLISHNFFCTKSIVKLNSICNCKISTAILYTSILLIYFLYSCSHPLKFLKHSMSVPIGNYCRMNFGLSGFIHPKKSTSFWCIQPLVSIWQLLISIFQANWIWNHLINYVAWKIEFGGEHFYIPYIVISINLGHVDWYLANCMSSIDQDRNISIDWLALLLWRIPFMRNADEIVEWLDNRWNWCNMTENSHYYSAVCNRIHCSNNSINELCIIHRIGDINLK